MSTIKKYLDAEGVSTLWNKIKQDFSKTDSGTYCDTDGNVAAKVATHSGYVLRTGNCSMITFTKSNTVTDSITLNVNNTGAKPLLFPSTGGKNIIPGAFSAGTYYLYYNGSSYILMRTFDDVSIVLFPDQVGSAAAPIFINEKGKPTVASTFTSGTEDQIMCSNGTAGVKWLNSAPKSSVAARVNKSLSIQLNGGDATEFNGSAEQNINITPSSIGAASADNVVTLSDTQTITGNKTFSGAITTKSNSHSEIITYPMDVVTTQATNWVAIASINIASSACRGIYNIEFMGSGRSGSNYYYDKGRLTFKLRDQSVYTSVSIAASDAAAVFEEYSGVLSFGIRMSGTTATLYAKIDSTAYCFSLMNISANASTLQSITVPRFVVLTSDPSITAIKTRKITISD